MGLRAGLIASAHSNSTVAVFMEIMEMGRTRKHQETCTSILRGSACAGRNGFIIYGLDSKRGGGPGSVPRSSG